MDEILSPLIMQGQPVSHICAQHKSETRVSERSIYNYIEAGELTVSNLDLRRKVRYKKRRKKNKDKVNKFSYWKGRTYEDFKQYVEADPRVAVVEMDTVRGNRTKEQVLLTFIFQENSIMLMVLIKHEDMSSVLEVFDQLTKKIGLRRFH